MYFNSSYTVPSLSTSLRTSSDKALSSYTSANSKPNFSHFASSDSFNATQNTMKQTSQVKFGQKNPAEMTTAEITAELVQRRKQLVKTLTPEQTEETIRELNLTGKKAQTFRETQNAARTSVQQRIDALESELVRKR